MVARAEIMSGPVITVNTPAEKLFQLGNATKHSHYLTLRDQGA